MKMNKVHVNFHYMADIIKFYNQDNEIFITM